MSGKQDFERGKETKKKIIEAAMELFAEHGYKGTSVRKIAGKVGIRESALYNHFENKEAIFTAIASRVFTSPFSHQNDPEFIRDYAKRGKPFLHKYVTEFKLMTFDKKSERLFRFMMIELLQNDTLRAAFQKEFHDANIKTLSSALFIMMQEGLIRSEDPMVMANAFLAPLFYLRLQVSLLKADQKTTTPLSTAFEKQLNLFWASVALL